MYIEIQDGYLIRKTDVSGTLINPAKIISAAYQFEMVYDSTSRVQYLFSECMYNGVRPRLIWRNDALHSASTEMMSDSSRTDNFKIVPGDTVSFYREFSWYNPMNHRQDTNNFMSLDTLDYAVELVSAATTHRLALLDSFGVLPQLIPGVPTFYGSHPIAARIRYLVPSTIPTGDSVFVRVRLYARGDGYFLPIRYDTKTIGSSFALAKGVLDTYLSLYGGSLSKRPVPELEQDFRVAGTSLLSVQTAGSGWIEIRIGQVEGTGPFEVLVYDAGGNVVFVPFSTRMLRGMETVTHHFSSSGTYFVALRRGGRVLDIKKITITL